MHNLLKVGIALSLSMALAACSSTPKDEGADGGMGGAGGAGGAATAGAAQGAGWNGSSLSEADRQRLLNTLTIYFDFDSSEIRAEFQNVVTAHGEYLATHPEEKVTIEGHGDERGSREYNIALGERRANTVKRHMMSHGASERQMQVISYGEERPAVEGSGEQVWSQNRRAQLVY